jgi:hypothetical protein
VPILIVEIDANACHITVDATNNVCRTVMQAVWSR